MYSTCTALAWQYCKTWNCSFCKGWKCFGAFDLVSLEAQTVMCDWTPLDCENKCDNELGWACCKCWEYWNVGEATTWVRAYFFQFDYGDIMSPRELMISLRYASWTLSKTSIIKEEWMQTAPCVHRNTPITLHTYLKKKNHIVNVI